jgi:putative heme-binding domain-containing protein
MMEGAIRWPLAWLLLSWAGAALGQAPKAGQPPRDAKPALSAAADVRVAAGFKFEALYSVPRRTQGSWVALCTDPKGRLIAADQNGKLYRMSLPAPGESESIQPEALGVDLAGAHGLLYAFDSLYVMVNERGTHGLYRVRDSNGDDRYDELKLLRAIRGGGEHGMHSIVLSPDGKSLYVVCGNATELTKVDRSRLPLTWGEDNLVPRIPTGFMDDSLAPQGWIARTDPDGKEWELIAAGLRNPFDIAFNHDGELFTYDADMEWDIGQPWYRPTRINHVISGAEFGFRNGSGKWPASSIDSFGAVVDIGPGSPTGITFGYGAKFPEKYRNALFISDWSFGKLRAVHLKPEGASYTAEVEEFLSGQPLPVTDVVINPKDGAMYLAVGGRGAQSALYRVTYIGGPIDTSTPAPMANGPARAMRSLRHKLESFHGRQDAAAVGILWPYLRDQDRAIRYAARVALEWQDPAQWRQKALDESDPRTAIAAMVALARASGRDQLHRKPIEPLPDPTLRRRMLAALHGIDWSRLEPSDRVDLLRAYGLVFTRLGRPDDAACRRLSARLAPLFPSRAVEADFLLAELLAYLQDPSAAAKIMAALREAPTQEEKIQYALVLRVLKTGWTLPLREEYFRWFVTEAASFRGGNTFANSLRTIKSQAMKTLSDSERTALKQILETSPVRKSPRDLLAARKPVKAWTLAELLPVVERGLGQRRDLERGRRLYGAVACASCHRFRVEGGGVGPDLTAVAGRFSVRDLLESIVEPDKVISDQYAAVSIATKDGRVVTGRVGNLHGDSLSVIEDMFDPGRTTDVKRENIEEMKPSPISPMPTGLLNSLNAEEIQDLVGFLLARDGGQAHRGAGTSETVIPVWPDRAPGSESWTQKELEYRNDWDHKPMVRNVTTPTLTAFLPEPSTATGAAVVVCPGGGFRFLSWESEGTAVAEWLRARGVAAFVLKYRLVETAASEEEFRKEMAAFFARIASRRDRPAAAVAPGEAAPKDHSNPGEASRRAIPDDMRTIAALASDDGRQAIKVVRQRAAEWGIKPDRIGIMGFSAGGIVTMDVVMKHDADSRPDFAAPIYGGGTGGARVPDDAPPLFVLCASDDFLAASGSARLYSEWKAAGRPIELHIYEKGGHGFGMTPKGLPVDHWIERFGDWLAQRGLIKRSGPSETANHQTAR